MKNILLALTLVLPAVCSSQDGYDWGEDKITAQQKWHFVIAASKAKRFKEASARVYWLLNNAPKLHVDLLSPGGQDVGVLIGTQDGSYNINFYGTMTLTPAMTYANEWQHLIPDLKSFNFKRLEISSAFFAEKSYFLLALTC